MRNYGFDYLVNKAQLLNEMGRQSGFWETNFPEFYQIIKKTHNVMKGMVPPDKKIDHIRIAYMGMMLMKFLKIKGEYRQLVNNLTFEPIPPNERAGLQRKRPTQGYMEFNGGQASTPKQQDYFLSTLVRDNYEAATSQKFVDMVTNPENIKPALEKLVDRSNTSNFAWGTKKRKEALTGMGQDDLRDLQSKGNLLLRKLRKSKKIPMGLRTSIHHIDNDSIKEKSMNFDKELYPVVVMVNTLEQFLDYKQQIKQDLQNGEDITPQEEALNKFNTTSLIQLLDTFQKRLDEKKPVALEKIQGVISKMVGISDQVQAEYDGLYEDLQSSGTDALQGRYESIYDMLDDELLGSLVAGGELSPEEAETLKKWSGMMAKLHQNVRTKGERILTKAQEAQMKAKRVEDAKKKYEETGKKWAAQKEAKKKGIKIASPVDDELEGLSVDEVEDKLRELMDTDDPDFDKIKAVTKYLKTLKQSNVQENHIMGYFTEQVEKDRLTHKHGEFKDRGFKKPVNYAHWLWINDN